jgi:hypothetical protein
MIFARTVDEIKRSNKTYELLFTVLAIFTGANFVLLSKKSISRNGGLMT